MRKHDRLKIRERLKNYELGILKQMLAYLPISFIKMLVHSMTMLLKRKHGLRTPKGRLGGDASIVALQQ